MGQQNGRGRHYNARRHAVNLFCLECICTPIDLATKRTFEREDLAKSLGMS